MTHLISLFIDDEMELDEKVEFVETVRDDDCFARETLDFLAQEKMIQGNVVLKSPQFELKRPFDLGRFLKPLGLGAAAAAVFALLYFFIPHSGPIGPAVADRFVIYRPDARQVEISGTFTEWSRLPLNKIGDSGYWEISLNVSAGEHRYTYIIDGDRVWADPTRLTREADDFGGYNSVYKVEGKV